MPSYNMPPFSPIPTPSSVMSTAPSQSSPGPQRRPAPLTLTSQPCQLKTLPSPYQQPRELPRSPTSSWSNPPACVQCPFSSTWYPGVKYFRSPLALCDSTDHVFQVRQRLRDQHYAQFQRAPPSKRYTRPPPLKSFSPAQDFTILPHFVGGPSDSREARSRLLEDLIARTLERRLTDKARRSQMGERAGLGLSGGREMLIMAVLSNVRLAKQRAVLASAPPTQQSFYTNRPLSERDVQFARSRGHKKSVSSSALPPPRPIPIPLPSDPSDDAGPSNRPSFDSLKKLISRRSTKGTQGGDEDPNGERPLPLEPPIRYSPPPASYKNRSHRRSQSMSITVSLGDRLDENENPPFSPTPRRLSSTPILHSQSENVVLDNSQVETTVVEITDCSPSVPIDLDDQIAYAHHQPMDIMPKPLIPTHDNYTDDTRSASDQAAADTFVLPSRPPPVACTPPAKNSLSHASSLTYTPAPRTRTNVPPLAPSLFHNNNTSTRKEQSRRQKFVNDFFSSKLPTVPGITPPAAVVLTLPRSTDAENKRPRCLSISKYMSTLMTSQRA